MAFFGVGGLCTDNDVTTNQIMGHLTNCVKKFSEELSI